MARYLVEWSIGAQRGIDALNPELRRLWDESRERLTADAFPPYSYFDAERIISGQESDLPLIRYIPEVVEDEPTLRIDFLLIQEGQIEKVYVVFVGPW